MSWLPNFLNIWPAAIAGSIAAALLLVLYFLKLRRREMDVSSTLLWKKAIQDLQVNAPFQRLRRNLLLLLQMFLLILLALALSRPVVNYTPGAGSLTAILIDRSASMSATDISGKSRLDDAKKRARELVDGMPRNAWATVIAFDDAAHVIQPMTSDTLALRNAIDSIKPSDRKSRLKLAYQLAEAQGSQAAAEREQRQSQSPLDVWVFSDGRIADADELRSMGGMNVKYQPIGAESSKNIGIVALSAKRNYERPTEVQVFARLANFGPDPITADVQLTVDGQTMKVSTQSLVLLPERWTEDQRNKAQSEHGLVARDSVEFTLDLPNAAVIAVEQMNKDGDVLPADNIAQIVVPPPKTLQVVLVTDYNWYLERLVQNLNIRDAKFLLPNDYEDKMARNDDAVTKADVIIYDRYVPQKRPPVGNFIYIAAVPPDLPVKVIREPQENKPQTFTDIWALDWQRDHPILRGLSLRKLYAESILALDVPLGAQVLVEGTKGPMIVLDQDGRSTHMIIAFDLLPSTWPLRPSFVWFGYNTLQYLALGSELDLRQSYEPGETPRIARANLAKIDANLSKVSLKGPIYADIPIPATGDFALPALEKVGVYRTDPPIPQFQTFAVNLLDADESNILPATQPPGGLGEQVAAKRKSRLDLWWWIVLCGAIPLLLIEWWVYTRRVHL